MKFTIKFILQVKCPETANNKREKTQTEETDSSDEKITKKIPNIESKENFFLINNYIELKQRNIVLKEISIDDLKQTDLPLPTPKISKFESILFIPMIISLCIIFNYYSMDIIFQQFDLKFGIISMVLCLIGISVLISVLVFFLKYIIILQMFKAHNAFDEFGQNIWMIMKYLVIYGLAFISFITSLMLSVKFTRTDNESDTQIVVTVNETLIWFGVSLFVSVFVMFVFKKANDYQMIKPVEVIPPKYEPDPLLEPFNI